MQKNFRNSMIAVLILSVLQLSSPLVAQAKIIGTLESLQTAQRDADLSTINAALARDEVRAKLSELGVQSGQVETRVAAMTDAELRTLASDIESAPAGAGAVAVIGVVFLVLLILEAVGVIDIFKKFP
ncbi:MAG TPA: PA2779 family protein [Steroidobacteraceae bacterium]|nr:PA2779 family protein [Steroidobacteraceae bacterium]